MCVLLSICVCVFVCMCVCLFFLSLPEVHKSCWYKTGTHHVLINYIPSWFRLSSLWLNALESKHALAVATEQVSQPTLSHKRSKSTERFCCYVSLWWLGFQHQVSSVHGNLALPGSLYVLSIRVTWLMTALYCYCWEVFHSSLSNSKSIRGAEISYENICLNFVGAAEFSYFVLCPNFITKCCW